MRQIEFNPLLHLLLPDQASSHTDGETATRIKSDRVASDTSARLGKSSFSGEWGKTPTLACLFQNALESRNMGQNETPANVVSVQKFVGSANCYKKNKN